MKKIHIRRLVITISFLLMPITFAYLSPVIPIWGALSGVISGSVILFSVLFLSSMLIGRLFCAWLCPFGGASECVMYAVNKPVKNSKPLHIVRHVIWLAWLGSIIFVALSAGGYSTVDPFYHTYMGLSLHTEGGRGYAIYFVILALCVILTLVFGKRSGCHGICHIANFMIFGKKLGRLLRLPRVHMKMDSVECVSCDKCTLACPMSLDVEDMVKKQDTENPYCILCGDCTKECSKGVIQLAFGRPDKKDNNRNNRHLDNAK